MPPELLFHERASVSAALVQSLTHWNKLPVRERWLVNSHPKAGTFLPRNILMHFNSGALHQHILFYDTFRDALGNKEPHLYTGHIPYALLNQAAPQIGRLQSVLLIRHPCSIALALARSFYDRNSDRPDHLYLRENESFEGVVANIVGGYQCAGVGSAPLATSLMEFSVEWRGNTRFTLRYEDLIARLTGPDDELVAYLAPMLGAMFGRVPEDAAERIRAGADTSISATYSRTASWTAQTWSPSDVYGLVAADKADELRQIAAQLGYAE